MPSTTSTTSTTKITTGGKCTPFLLRVMVFSPESGYKFTIEVQKACSDQNDPIWKLLFDLYKQQTNGDFVELVSVEFVAGDPNDINKIAAITDEGIKRPQVRAFRDNVYPLVKPFATSGTNPSPAQKAQIDQAIKTAINS
jgi:hypothetical protein